MSQSYKVKVNNSHNFNFTSDAIIATDAVATSNNQYHVLQNSKSFDVEILQSDFNVKAYTVQVNGNTYDVEISDDLDMLIAELGLEVSLSKKENDLKAPMPGLIVSIDVEVGQEVAEGDGILVLEAMKMENMLTAPRDGVIKAITVKAGDKVDKKQILIEME